MPKLKTMILNGSAQLTQAQDVGRQPRDQVLGDVQRLDGAAPK